jgi:hypothetical protein
MVRSLLGMAPDTADASIDVTTLKAYKPVVTKALKAAKGALPTIAQLQTAGLAQDVIDAVQAITGYSDAQIVVAIITLVLGASAVPAGATAAPAALLGGVKIILEMA